jgi:hypothetical protein
VRKSNWSIPNDNAPSTTVLLYCRLVVISSLQGCAATHPSSRRLRIIRQASCIPAWHCTIPVYGFSGGTGQ